MTYLKIEKTKAIHICFIGCGAITKAHAKRALKADNHVMLSFASRMLEKAESYCEKFNGTKAFGDYHEAFDDTEVNVVMINTPPNSHLELSKKALIAGKHIIVEKPPFFRSEDFDEVGKLAEDRHLQFMIAENYFYKPLRRVIKNLLSKRIIGDPLFVMINATKTQKTKGDWRDDKEIAGYGALYEGGIHWINFINNMGFNINMVNGFMPRKRSDLERSMQVTATTKEGAVINLLYSWEVNTMAKGLRISKIYGREGSITFETNGLFVWVRGKKKRLIFPGLKHISGYQKMFDDFFTALRSGQSPELSWRRAKEDLQIVERAYETST